MALSFDLADRPMGTEHREGLPRFARQIKGFSRKVDCRFGIAGRRRVACPGEFALGSSEGSARCREPAIVRFEPDAGGRVVATGEGEFGGKTLKVQCLLEETAAEWLIGAVRERRSNLSPGVIVATTIRGDSPGHLRDLLPEERVTGFSGFLNDRK